MSSPAAPLHAPPTARRPRPQPSPSASRLAFDAPRPANGRAGRRRLRRRAGGSARPGVSPAAATAAGSCRGDPSGYARLQGCSRRRRARRGAASRRARGPGAWLRDAPSRSAPSMGKLHSKPGQCPRPRAGPLVPAALAPAVANSLLLLSFWLPPRAMCLQPPCASAGRARKVGARGARTGGDRLGSTADGGGMA